MISLVNAKNSRIFKPEYQLEIIFFETFEIQILLFLYVKTDHIEPGILRDKTINGKLILSFTIINRITPYVYSNQ